MTVPKKLSDTGCCDRKIQFPVTSKVTVNDCRIRPTLRGKKIASGGTIDGRVQFVSHVTPGPYIVNPGGNVPDVLVDHVNRSTINQLACRDAAEGKD